MNKQKLMTLLAALFLGASLAACSGGKTEVESDLGIEDAPDWVNEGYQALDNRDGRMIHGVGSAPKMTDMSLQRSTADDRARAEVGRVLSTFMDVVADDYLATAGYGDATVDEQAISRQIQAVTRLNMAGSEIIARWRNEKNGAIYSLAELDLKRVENIVSKADKMNEGFRSHLLEKGETLFDAYMEENR